MPRATDERGRDGSHRQQLRVGAFRIDAGALQVEADGQTTRLTPKAMGVLLALARAPGVTLSRDELLDEVWGSAHVTPGVVGHAVTALRRAFGDDPERPAYIETIPRIGYRLVAPVRALTGAETGPEGEAVTDGVGEPAGPDVPAIGTASVSASTTPATGALPEPQASSPSLATSLPGEARPGRSRPWWSSPMVLVLVLSALLVALAAIAWRYASQPPAQASLVAEAARRITFAPGSEASPRLSPGGDWLVYTRRDRLGGAPGLFLQSLHGTEPIALADGDHAERPAWSPNGREIAYVWRPADETRCEIRTTSIDGGGHLKLADCPPHSVVYLDWNPADPDQIAYSTILPGSPGSTRIQLLRRAGGWAAEPFEYGPMETPVDLYPRFSPDGSRIAFRRGSNPTSDLYWVSSAGGEAVRLTTLRSEISGFDWLPDGSGLVFSSNHQGDRALYTVESAGGRITALGIRGASSPDIAQRDWTLAFQLESWRSALAEVALDAGGVRWLAPSSGRDFSAAMSADNARVVFASDRDGSSQLWLLDRGDGKTTRLTRHESGRAEAPVLSADGRRVLYVLRIEGRHELHEFDLEQGVSHRVAAAGASLRNATYASDDRSIWYTGWHVDGWRLHACRRASGESGCRGQPTPLPAFRVERATVQGRAALLLTEGSDRGRIAAVAEDDLRPLPMAPFSVEEPWRVVDDAVWALEPGDAGQLVLVAHSLREDGDSQRLATLPGLQLLLGEGFQVSADRRRLVLPVATEDRSDIGVSRLTRKSG
ncbi:winged helix-turn-helix domain-containing protein [Luteimonas sp. SDU101]|uniref:winged helix-turn-helix domain-containing protein n=1 Tax=Luteimonas sp. SDU101 TaxID=3422593 RepID=UPI003EC032CD